MQTERRTKQTCLFFMPRFCLYSLVFGSSDKYVGGKLSIIIYPLRILLLGCINLLDFISRKHSVVIHAEVIHGHVRCVQGHAV